jgi:hypothetical protein
LTFAPGPARDLARSVETVKTKETHDVERLERRHDLGGLVLHGPLLGAADRRDRLRGRTALPRPARDTPHTDEEPRTILDCRLASGEIDVETYEKLRRTLGAAGGVS